MLGKCGLAPDINRCPHYDANMGSCTINNDVCGFFRNPEVKKEINNQRQPKWFEQYYDR